MSTGHTRTILFPSVALGVVLLALGAFQPRPAEQASAGPLRSRAPLAPSAASWRAAFAITDEAMRLYADGQFPAACDRLLRAADDAPANFALRENAGRCFEGWGWHALRDGRPAEAMPLFRQGLRDAPRTPGLLKGLGVAAVQAGHPDAALAPLEEVLRIDDDARVRLLLAYLYDRRDDDVRSMNHLRALLAREPTHGVARRLLEKLQRERGVEVGFRRELTPHFVVKVPASIGPERYLSVVKLLEGAWERLAIELDYRPGERITVVLYPRSEFEAITGHEWAGGVFDGKIRLPVALAERDPRDLERLILHEYAHAAVHELSRGRAPRWLHEGLAQVLEGAVVDPMLRVPGSPTLRGVEALVTDPDPMRARTGYDIALWIVRDLVDRGGLNAMRKLLARLGSGEGLDQATTRVYGLRLTELESQWRRLLGG